MDAVDRNSLAELKEKYPHMWELIEASVREQLDCKIDGTPFTLLEKKAKPESAKDSILSQIEKVKDMALADSDLPGVLKSLELQAKLHALLTSKAEVDPVININVITGVPRGDA